MDVEGLQFVNKMTAAIANVNCLQVLPARKCEMSGI